MNNVFIIAEAGVNHNGSIALAKKLIDAACDCGASAIKFQTFCSEELVAFNAPKAAYQLNTTAAEENQMQMLKKYELSYADHVELIRHCNDNKILFISSPFDNKSIDFLNELGLDILKIPSGEITNIPYLRKIGKLEKKIILSTGMATLGEIENALKELINSGTPKDNITLLHCTTEYPAPMNEVNLNAMITLRNAFKMKVGYSDHTRGIEIPIAAVALGAGVIEKHMTLDNSMEGPDHKASLPPGEFKKMIFAIRNIEEAMGDGVKSPGKSEILNKKSIRKSIVACNLIKKGEIFTSVKRPAGGICPARWDEVVGRKATREFQKDEFIEI